MAVNATNNGGTPRELIESGNYPARCISVIHIGTIEDTWKGQPKMMNKVRIVWEIPHLTKVFDPAKGPQPMSISMDYTLSTGEKSNLRKMLESWRGKDFTPAEIEKFDVLSVVGAPCFINIIHKMSSAGNEYETITAVTRVPQGTKIPPMINPKLLFDFEENFSAAKLEAFPDFLKEKIKKSKEYKQLMDPSNVEAGSKSFIEDNPDDDLPF